MDHLHVVNQIIKHSHRPLYKFFIDYVKAFDSVYTAAGLEALTDQGIVDTCIRLLDEIYKRCTGRIILYKQSGLFPIRKSVRQGYSISQKLFAAYLEGVFSKPNWGNRCLRLNDDTY